MKKFAFAFLLVLIVVFNFVGCKEYEPYYTDPFAGKTFIENYNLLSEKVFSFDNNGTCKILQYEAFSTLPIGETFTTETGMPFEMKKIVIEIANYSFDGPNQTLTLTPVKVYLPKICKFAIYSSDTNPQIWQVTTSTDDTIDEYDEYLNNIVGGKLLDKDGYLEELNTRLPGGEYNQAIADGVFHSCSYTYEFSKKVIADDPYRLTLKGLDDYAGNNEYIFTKVFKTYTN